MSKKQGSPEDILASLQSKSLQNTEQIEQKNDAKTQNQAQPDETFRIR